MRFIGINVIIVGWGQRVLQSSVGEFTVPFASARANLTNDTQPIQLRKRDVLGSFAIEFEQVDLLDSTRSECLPKFGHRHLWNINSEVFRVIF